MKCIDSAQKLGVWAILGVKTEIFIFLNPQKAPHWAKTRVLTYHSPKSARGFDRGAIPIKKTKKSYTWPAFRQISPPPGDAIADPIRTKFGTYICLVEPIISTNIQLVRLRTERVRSFWKYRIMAKPALHRFAPLTRLSPAGLPVICHWNYNMTSNDKLT